MSEHKSLNVNGCRVDILAIIKGLVSESSRVLKVITNGYDAAGIALGPEDVKAMELRANLETPDMSDLDLVYCKILKEFGEIDVPVPAYCALIDACAEHSVPLVPLDMDDEVFSELYCNTVTALELLREQKLAAKGLKMTFDLSSPESFAAAWDAHVNTVKGFRKMSEFREEFIADRIKELSSGKERILVVVEYERFPGIVERLK